MLCQAYAHGSPHTQIVGLCHSVQHTTRELAELVGVPLEEVDVPRRGLNHQAFFLRLERDGEDLYPRLDAAIDARSRAPAHASASSSTAGSATSRPSPASTRPSTCRG